TQFRANLVEQARTTPTPEGCPPSGPGRRSFRPRPAANRRGVPMTLGRHDEARGRQRPVTVFGPDFPFAFDDWIEHPVGLGSIPAERHGEEVAVVGAGISGLIAAYELMRLGLRP